MSLFLRDYEKLPILSVEASSSEIKVNFCIRVLEDNINTYEYCTEEGVQFRHISGSQKKGKRWDKR